VDPQSLKQALRQQLRRARPLSRLCLVVVRTAQSRDTKPGAASDGCVGCLCGPGGLPCPGWGDQVGQLAAMRLDTGPQPGSAPGSRRAGAPPPASDVVCGIVLRGGLAARPTAVSLGYCGGWHIRAAHLGGRPGRGRMGAMAEPPWRRGPDHSAGTASTAAATA
jgi:hypothetical protein